MKVTVLMAGKFPDGVRNQGIRGELYLVGLIRIRTSGRRARNINREVLGFVIWDQSRVIYD